jgi:hypothetical protein
MRQLIRERQERQEARLRALDLQVPAGARKHKAAPR